MGIAAGGLIEQTIALDTHLTTDWDRDNTLVFNAQILDTVLFQKITGMNPPAPLLDANTYVSSDFLAPTPVLNKS
jgi:hypothetical protein